jgi:hypothetical protein
MWIIRVVLNGVMTSTLSGDAWMPASFSLKPSAVDGIRRCCQASHPWLLHDIASSAAATQLIPDKFRFYIVEG